MPKKTSEDERWFIVLGDVYLSDSSNGDVRHQDSSSDKLGYHRVSKPSLQPQQVRS